MFFLLYYGCVIFMDETKEVLRNLFQKWGVDDSHSCIEENNDYGYELKVVRTPSKHRVSLLYDGYVCACYVWEVEEAKENFYNWMSSGKYSYEEVKLRMKRKYNKKNYSSKKNKSKKIVNSKDDLRERVSFLESKNKELLLKVNSLESENEELTKYNNDLGVKVIGFEKERYDHDAKINSFLKERWGYNDTYSYSRKYDYFKTKKGRRPFNITWRESYELVKKSKNGMNPSLIFSNMEFTSDKVNEETVFNFLERYYSGRMIHAFEFIYNNYPDIPEEDKENYVYPAKWWE